MKRAVNLLFVTVIVVTLMSISGCSDSNRVSDENTEVPGHNWKYTGKFKYAVQIDDEKVPYNIYMNLRVTADYKYANLFVLITQTGPDKKSSVKRYELKLANKDGEWLGEGSGNLYNYQLLLLANYKFTARGHYTFTIEQNMRDNPLKEVSDVGLRVEKVN